jgi:hypothetical protein
MFVIFDVPSLFNKNDTEVIDLNANASGFIVVILKPFKTN